MRKLSLVLGALLLVCSRDARPAPRVDVRLICSFEPAEMTAKGFTPAAWSNGDLLLPRLGWNDCLLRQQRATDGQWAVCWAYTISGNAPPGFPHVLPCYDEEQMMSYFAMLYGSPLGGGDWSGFDFLCIDVFTAEGDF